MSAGCGARSGTGGATGCSASVDESARCFSCRLTRRRPESDDTIALEKLAETAVAKRRLIVQLLELGLPIVPFHERDGGLGFDLVSSRSGEQA